MSQTGYAARQTKAHHGLMAYIVHSIDDLYEDPDLSNAENVRRWLTEAETHGFKLLAVIPDHDGFDHSENKAVTNPAMLVLHSDTGSADSWAQMT